MTAASTSRPGRGRIYDSITQTIGDTPLVRLNRLPQMQGIKAHILAKLEFFNPISSVKDRIGVSMIEAMEADGRVGPDTVLIEPTSGNTGIALAFVAAARGYRLILVMPDSMSIERRKMLALLGAELVLTPAAQGMTGAVKRAAELAREINNAVIPQQFRIRRTPTSTAAPPRRKSGTTPMAASTSSSPASAPAAPSRASARCSRHASPRSKIVAVEPEDSPLLSQGRAGPHKIQGIGANFVPDILDRAVIDEVLTVGNQTAFDTARALARYEGMPCGISAGAAIAAALRLAARPEMAGKMIVAVVPDFAERYLSTALFEGL